MLTTADRPTPTCHQTHARTPKWVQKRRWIAITCWVAVGMEDDISHAVVADDGVDAKGAANKDDRVRGSPHTIVVAWLRTCRRRRGCEPPSERVNDGSVKLPLDGSGRSTHIRDGGIVEDSGAMGRSRVETNLTNSVHFGLNPTKPTNSTHWKWIKFWDSIPSWAKCTEHQIPIEFNPIRGNQMDAKGINE
jgi:hypothetical protein